MTREEKDECLRKLQYIVDRANWGTIDRDENGLPLGIRYASDVAEVIEKDSTFICDKCKAAILKVRREMEEKK